MNICSLVKWFAIQMPINMVVWYSDHHLADGLVLKSSFEYRSNMQVNFSFYDQHACITLNLMDVFLFNTH